MEETVVKLARITVEKYIRENKIPVLLTGEDLKAYGLDSEDFQKLKASHKACFVTLYKEELRGCIGTLIPYRENLAEEIIHNAISACSEDPRFPRVAVEELEDLVYSVDVLGEAEKVKSVEELDPKRYGIIVSKGQRRGVLLPNLDGVDTVDQQIHITLQKAGIYPEEDFEIERFEVVRYEE